MSVELVNLPRRWSAVNTQEIDKDPSGAGLGPLGKQVEQLRVKRLPDSANNGVSSRFQEVLVIQKSACPTSCTSVLQ